MRAFSHTTTVPNGPFDIGWRVRPVYRSSSERSYDRQQWGESTHSLTLRPDIRGCRYANGRKVTRSRLTDFVTPTSAQAEDSPLGQTSMYWLRVDWTAKYQTARALRTPFRRRAYEWNALCGNCLVRLPFMRLYGSWALLGCSAAAHQPLISIAMSIQIRATRFVAIVPRLSFRLGDQYVLCPRVSLSAPPLSVQSLADRPSWLPK